MFKRLQQSSLNLLVLGASAAVFVAAFLFLNGFVAARTPESTVILTAGRRLQIGEMINPADLVEQPVFVDGTTSLYFSAAEAGDLAGALAALPIAAGQPILREHVISGTSTANRFAALLTEFPGHSLFPIPLESANIISPPAGMFLPGDLVGITVVIGGRPQAQTTPSPDSFAFSFPGAPEDVTADGIPIIPAGNPDSELDELAYPPLAKDLFPQGARVIAIEGLPTPADPDDPAPAFNQLNTVEMLILLVPDDGRERLSLALQQGDMVFISFLGHFSAQAHTPGFTYWDFEAWFRADRPQPEAP